MALDTSSKIVQLTRGEQTKRANQEFHQSAYQVAGILTEYIKDIATRVRKRCSDIQR